MWDFFSYQHIYPKRFRSQECQAIIGLADNLPNERNVMSNRDSGRYWIYFTQNTKWIFDRLWEIVSEFNEFYEFEIERADRAFQLTRYETGQFYDWHMDLGGGAVSTRKISLVVELQAATKGGGLEIFRGGENSLHLEAGDTVVFPAWIMHQARKVEDGERWSLVQWVEGTRPFR